MSVDGQNGYNGPKGQSACDGSNDFNGYNGFVDNLDLSEKPGILTQKMITSIVLHSDIVT